jgi:predicted HNH restriction endonuclease
MKKCFQCKEQKELTEFYKNKSNKDKHSGICKQCQSKNEKENNLKTKEWVSTLKKKCSMCDEKRSWVLDFHHLDPSKKTMNISTYSISGTAAFETKQNKILKELENCIIVCSNCHRDIHYRNNICK